MRVIGGSARGRRLKGPPRPTASGRPGIRPTSDLVRGVIFNMLDALGADYSRVLDLYAGTGALGIEALSRGDGTADFVEKDATAAGIIRSNLQATGLADRGRVHAMSVERAAQALRGPYTLVLADPPYHAEDVFGPVELLARPPLVEPETVIVVEHRRGVEPRDALGGIPLYKSRRHGDSVVSIYAGEVS